MTAMLDIEALRRHLQAREPDQPVELIETHVSWVLLQGPWAYKLKKPLQLGFLDFTTLAARRHACEEELRLNRRLAPSLYVDVLPVTGSRHAPTLGGPGDAIDHAVRMRRFGAGDLFSERLASARLTPAHVDALAQRLADFHAEAPPASVQSAFGAPQTIAAATQQVLERLAAQALPGDAPRLARVQGWLQQQAVALAPAWQARRHAGWVRECHGDLHLANAIVVPEGGAEGATAFDGIEFDPALRWIDVMSDVAFLMMDLQARGRRDLAFRFLDGWLERTGDHAGLAVLRYYMVFRALVRALVARLRARQTGAAAPDGPDYLGTALDLCTAAAPRLLATHGLSGSGKTWVTQALLEAAGAVRIRSDVERKRLHGLQALEPSGSASGGGLYTATANARTYAELARLAALSLSAGFPTIVDAACLQRAERAGFAALAQVQQVPFALLHCHAGEAVLRQRITRRQARGCDASEADLEVLTHQLAAQQPLAGAELAQVIDVDTEQPLDAQALARQWLQRR